MKSWRTVSYTGSVTRCKRVIRAQVTQLLHTLFPILPPRTTIQEPAPCCRHTSCCPRHMPGRTFWVELAFSRFHGLKQRPLSGRSVHTVDAGFPRCRTARRKNHDRRLESAHPSRHRLNQAQPSGPAIHLRRVAYGMAVRWGVRSLQSPLQKEIGVFLLIIRMGT
jgi:hypothetical protein